MDVLALVGPAGRAILELTTEAGGETSEGLTINFFWIVVVSTTFIFFLALFRAFFSTPITKMLTDRQERIEQGLKDAEQARRDRENAETEHRSALQEARREANEIINRAQKVAEESREADIAATKEELERLRLRATADIEAEKLRAVADLRAEVADLALAAAGRVVGESMTDERQRRLVDEFLAETAGPESRGSAS